MPATARPDSARPHAARPVRRTRRRQVVPAVVAVTLVIAGCGGSDGTRTDTTATPSAGTNAAAATTAATRGSAPEGTAALAPLDADARDLGRVVVLGEESLLGDLLTLGVHPVAGSATVGAAGFQGLDEFDTANIEILPASTLRREVLAALRPDTIVALQSVVDELGRDAVEGLADVVVVPDASTVTDRMLALGELLGRPDHAAAAVAEYDTALTQARDRIGGDDCAISVATIAAGPSVTALVDGPTEIATSILAVGCALVPGSADVASDGTGRTALTADQLEVLAGDMVVLLQNDSADGAADSRTEIEASPSWQALPAVRNGRVEVFDRLGYPGLRGQIRFLDELSALLD